MSALLGGPLIKKEDKLDIEGDEYIKLIKASIDGKHIECSFGPSGPWLRDTPNNDWAFKFVKDLRAKEEKPT